MEQTLSQSKESAAPVVVTGEEGNSQELVTLQEVTLEVAPSEDTLPPQESDEPHTWLNDPKSRFERESLPDNKGDEYLYFGPEFFTNERSMQSMHTILEGLANHAPRELFELLSHFHPEQRAIFIEMTDWYDVCRGIALVKPVAGDTDLSEAATEALGEGNTRNLALYASRLDPSRVEGKYAALTLASTLPLESLSGIFRNIASELKQYREPAQTYNVLYNLMTFATKRAANAKHEHRGNKQPWGIYQISPYVVECLTDIRTVADRIPKGSAKIGDSHNENELRKFINVRDLLHHPLDELMRNCFDIWYNATDCKYGPNVRKGL